MPTRIIRDGWLESEPINSLDAKAEAFFLRLCLRADDFGRYHANPVLLKSNLYPLAENVKTSDMCKLLDDCERAGLIRGYTADGKKFVVIIKFNQRTRAETSKFPAPPIVNASHMPAVRGQMLPYAESDTEAEAQSVLLTAEPAREVGPSVEDVWRAYPRKVGKKKSCAIIGSLLRKNPASFAAELLAKTTAYAAATRRWPAGDEKFVPHPERWFNQERFNDDPMGWERGKVYRAAPQKPKAPECPQWKTILNHQFPDSIFAAGGLHEAREWSDVSHEGQQAIWKHHKAS